MDIINICWYVRTLTYWFVYVVRPSLADNAQPQTRIYRWHVHHFESESVATISCYKDHGLPRVMTVTCCEDKERLEN